MTGPWFDRFSACNGDTTVTAAHARTAASPGVLHERARDHPERGFVDGGITLGVIWTERSRHPV